MYFFLIDRLVLVFEIIIEDFYFSKETDITLLLAQNFVTTILFPQRHCFTLSQTPVFKAHRNRPRISTTAGTSIIPPRRPDTRAAARTRIANARARTVATMATSRRSRVI